MNAAIKNKENIAHDNDHHQAARKLIIFDLM